MTLVDIARKLKLSHATVSRALNPEKSHLISDETRRRVLACAEELNFVPNRAARDLVTGKSHAIGVLLPTMFNSLFFNEQLSKTLAGIYHELGQHKGFGCKLIILGSDGSLDELDRHALSTGIDGLLISAQFDHFSDKAPYFPKALLEKPRFPSVLINYEGKTSASNISVVSFSNFQAARQAVTYLIKKGHRNVALIEGKDNLADSKERRRGFEQALKDHRLPLHKNNIAVGNYTPESGYQAALGLFNRTANRPTAVFCTNDEMAMGALQALKALRIRCPQDVAVMGFDGLETGHYVQPRLTTVRQPSREIAQTGVQLLLDLIGGRKKGPQNILVPSDIIVRDSV